MKKIWNEFKKFALKGSMVEMAVGVVIGGAFSKIITSLVDYMIMPLFGLLLGGRDFSSLSITVGDAVIRYGSFIQSIIDFILVAVCVFIFVKTINMMREKMVPEETKPKTQTEEYLKEIRDLLQNSSPTQQNSK